MGQESSSTEQKTATTGNGERGAARRAKQNTAERLKPAQAQVVSLPIVLSALQDDLRLAIAAGASLRAGTAEGALVIVISSASQKIGWQNGEITIDSVPVTTLVLAEFEEGANERA